MRHRHIITSVAAAGALTLSACSANGGERTTGATEAPATTGATASPTASTTPESTTPTGGAGGPFARLEPLGSCSALLDHFKAEATERVGPYGLGLGPPIPLMAETTEVAAEDAAGSSEGSFTGTNTQESGVDEPDQIKTDGDRIISVRDNVLTVIDTETRQVIATHDLDGYGHEAFIVGDSIVVFGYVDSTSGSGDAESEFTESEFTESASTADMSSQYMPPTDTSVVRFDLNGQQLVRTAELRVEGNRIGAREIDGRVRLVVSSAPDLPWVQPISENGEARAEENNREVIAESTIDDWLPNYRLTVGGEVAGEGVLAACDRVHRPADFSGFNVLTVTDLDVAGDGFTVGAADATGVIADGETVYSSTDRMYVATNRWQERNRPDGGIEPTSNDFSTELHSFAITADGPTEYIASGSVDGSLLSQFSLDEHEGYLRVITTEQPPWESDQQSESTLTVLAEDGDRLVPVGSVGGLGKGESLYSARLMGDVGFAVTFRQIDPFYVLDLSDPTNPRVVGELKLPGVSTYLHQVDENRVLGVGRNATDDGQMLGFKLSMFDVSNPAAPVEVSNWTIDNADSPAEYDHRAFQIDGTRVYIPLMTYAGNESGAYVFDIAAGIQHVGIVSHAPLENSPCAPVTEEDHGSPELSDRTTAEGGVMRRCPSSDAVSPECYPMPVEELGTTSDGTSVAERLQLGPDEVIEMCYGSDQWYRQPDRSFVIDGELWTASPDRFQLSDPNTFEPIATITMAG